MNKMAKHPKKTAYVIVIGATLASVGASLWWINNRQQTTQQPISNVLVTQPSISKQTRDTHDLKIISKNEIATLKNIKPLPTSIDTPLLEQPENWYAKHKKHISYAGGTATAILLFGGIIYSGQGSKRSTTITDYGSRITKWIWKQCKTAISQPLGRGASNFIKPIALGGIGAFGGAVAFGMAAFFSPQTVTRSELKTGMLHISALACVSGISTAFKAIALDKLNNETCDDTQAYKNTENNNTSVLLGVLAYIVKYFLFVTTRAKISSSSSTQ